ncbi:hypothetical protein [Caballeronia hypogeia]|uniref:hypothetical protein n=1 Tax=Caballeronia hypogeia TaxID=1777140 RepID=UPI0007726469
MRQAARRDTLILARTDALAVEGLDAALERAERYLEASVDALFIEAPRSAAQMDAACSRLSHRDLSRRRGARGGSYAARLLRQLARARHERAVERA